jgi:hypothetical protein
MRPLALSGVLISEAAMVIYSPSSIKMGFGGRNTNAFRSVSQTGHGERMASSRSEVAASGNDEGSNSLSYPPSAQR